MSQPSAGEIWEPAIDTAQGGDRLASRDLFLAARPA